MYRGSSRIIPIAILLVVIAIAIIGLVTLGRALLGGSQTAKDDPAARALLTTDAEYSVRMTVRGPIVADENFRSYAVIISPTSRQMLSYTGYDDQILDSQQLSNTQEAYAQFVGALNRVDFTKSANLSDAQDDTQGVCATGKLYTFEILEAQSSVKRLWTTSCNGAPGSFRGNSAAARSLFLSQIPTSNDLLSVINLSA